ncbi:MAG: hypothetical protein C3F15_17975 [Holophagae bacterium]|nr:MAG: hypothetical protein C3F15_17975 [Holophagae bacterium]
MIEAVRHVAGAGAFPNLHALAVHFPVALLLVALLLDLGCLLVRGKVWLDRSATTLYVIGTAAAAAAFVTGRLAAKGATGLPADAGAVLADHGDLGLLTLIAYGLVTGLRAIVSWLGREDWRIKVGFFRLLALLASASALVLLMLTVDRGAELVYQHGVGQTQVTRPDNPPPSEQP